MNTTLRSTTPRASPVADAEGSRALKAENEVQLQHNYPNPFN